MIEQGDLARIVLDTALNTRIRERIALTVRPGKIDLLVYDPELDRDPTTGRVSDTGYKRREHPVTIEVRRGVLRVFYPDLARASETVPTYKDKRVPLDDVDAGVVADVIRRAIEAAEE